MFSILFINRPIFAKVISIFIVIVGLISLYLLPIAQFPQMTPPTIQVSAKYTGGSAQVVETSVTTPIEEQLNGVEGMIYMDSTSSSDGVSTINLYFKSGYDLNVAAIDVQNRVTLAMPVLPESVKQQGVTTKKKSTSMVQILTVKSSNPMHDALFLSNFASINIAEELKRIDGVGDVQNLGERKYSMRIWINPDKLSNLGISINEVTAAIKEQNLQAALGTVGSSPNNSSNKFQYTLTSKTKLVSAKEFEDVIIRQNSDGSKVRIKDIARVELGAENYSWSAKLNNKPTAALGIYQLPEANALDVATKVNEKIQELKDRFPQGVVVEASYDTTKFVEVSIEEVIQTLFEALLLVLFVVYIFLQSLRTTIIPAIAIPVSLIGTFALLLALDFSINTLTLFGLILAIGIVVDDAIIVVENVEANLEKNPNMTIKEATTKAMKEVFTPIVSTTLVLLAVFIPVTFIPGISGALYKQFATTISFSVIISAINALTLSPALCVTLLKKTKSHTQEHKKNFIFEKFDNALDSFKNVYKVILEKLIKYWKIVILVYFLLLGATYFAFKLLPTGFLPDEDQGTLVASISLQAGTTLNKTENTTDKIVEIMKETKGVRDVLSVAGFNLITGALDSSTATVFLVLEDWEKRTTKETSINSIIASINQKANTQIENANVKVFNMPSIPGLSAVGGFEVKLQNLQAMNIKEFEQKAQEFIKRLNEEKSIMMAYTTFNSNYPQYYIDINRDKVSALNLKLNDVFAVLQTYLGSLYINDFNKFGKTYRVFIQADENYRNEKNSINNYFVKNSKGDIVPLSTIVEIKRTSGVNTITHFNSYQSISINGVHNAKEGYSSGDAIKTIEKLAKETLDSEIGYEFAGLSLQEKEAGNAATYIFALSILMVFLFLAAQYESWMMPLMIMIPIPAVMFGALGANVIADLLNDTYTQIGLVLLIAMSCKNAILIIEFAKELREKGESIIESAMNASLLRLRAILMTIFAFLLGILPLVFASGAGAASRQSLGTAVFGGMVMSTILTLFLTPVLFVILQRLRERKNNA
ncbi:efflux RND transporter permease subunit [Malaciobacter mytili]|uniref:Hydrophobe/amphiphile efflux-1 family RND transporter n=1 Tax=Malaciobacter mytili LMG 24559 TaxID=1032238 RepID=A0AAX2ACP2_9BACT|nr:multidrug efflux RND transporter permease subunit [Malaciobacter mytili]AXH15451.1 RND family efflux system, inner membrane transporter, AcrB family [Malaciobacter mytili LMG 24559]RXK14747.1 hydrophobe/amphiphile efflux-1 family RND transporter [Malaciobacter mytili LMG 24559]